MRVAVRGEDAGAGDENCPERHPEAAVHGERCAREGQSSALIWDDSSHGRAGPPYRISTGHAARPLTGSAECVRARKLPHARHELRETADEERHADDDVRVRDPTSLRIVHRQYERRRREGVQATGGGGNASELERVVRNCDGTHSGPGLPILR